MRSVNDKFALKKARVRNKLVISSNGYRLSVFKSGRHVYAQIIDDSKSLTIVSASTLDKTIRKNKSCNYANKAYATDVGKLIGAKATKNGIDNIVFDRGGYKYHGVVKALAEAAREYLKF